MDPIKKISQLLLLPHILKENSMNTSLRNFLLKIFFALMSLSMIILVIITSIKSNMFALSESVVKEPWFMTTLVDFYFNITIISCWVIYKEKRLLIAILWIIVFILLGSIATAFYVFLQLRRLKPQENIGKIFLRE